MSACNVRSLLVIQFIWEEKLPTRQPFAALGSVLLIVVVCRSVWLTLNSSHQTPHLNPQAAVPHKQPHKR